MNGDDERDYDEEAAVQRDAESEGLAELEAERAEQVAVEQAVEQAEDHAKDLAGHMTGPAHYREAERLIASLDRGSFGDGTPIVREDDQPAIALAHVHAVLALAAATAANIRRNGAVTSLASITGDGIVQPDIAGSWYQVLR